MDRMIDQTYLVQSHLSTIQFQLSSALATQEMGGILKVSAKTLAKVNKKMDIESILQMTKSFAKETSKANMKQEIIMDTFDMVADPAIAVDADAFYEKILDAQALVIDHIGVAVPKEKVEESSEEVSEENMELG